MANRFAAPQTGGVPAEPRPVVQVVTPVRPELHKAMRVRAAEEGTTIRVLVMRGLRAIGLPVSHDDERDRRSARGNRRRGTQGGRAPARRGTR